MRRVPGIFLLMCLLLVADVFAQTSPLIMKHADSLAVARKRGTLLLQGCSFDGDK